MNSASANTWKNGGKEGFCSHVNFRLQKQILNGKPQLPAGNTSIESSGGVMLDRIACRWKYKGKKIAFDSMKILHNAHFIQFLLALELGCRAGCFKLFRRWKRFGFGLKSLNVTTVESSYQLNAVSYPLRWAGHTVLAAFVKVSVKWTSLIVSVGRKVSTMILLTRWSVNS